MGVVDNNFIDVLSAELPRKKCGKFLLQNVSSEGKSFSAIIQFLLEFLLVIFISSDDTLVSISLENNEKKCAESLGGEDGI